PLCAAGLARRLADLGLPQVRLVTGDWDRVDLDAPFVVPLISYGAIGTNCFEGFSGAYCLTGFYVSEEALDTVLQDVLASDGHIPVRRTTGGRRGRGKGGVLRRAHRLYDVHHLAQLALDQQEMDVVLQAVGRVRPYTEAREILTFQLGAHPLGAYDREFAT